MSTKEMLAKYLESGGSITKLSTVAPVAKASVIKLGKYSSAVGPEGRRSPFGNSIYRLSSVDNTGEGFKKRKIRTKRAVSR